MSAPEHFAVVKPVTDRVFDAPRGFLHDLFVGGERVVASSRESCERRAAAINAAVQRERQAAAAGALEEAAADLEANPRRGSAVPWLRDRAKRMKNGGAS